MYYCFIHSVIYLKFVFSVYFDNLTVQSELDYLVIDKLEQGTRPIGIQC